MCQHPNLIGFYDFFEDNSFFYMVLEYMDGGDLFDYLDRRDFKLEEDRAREISLQIASGVYFLHTYGIVHRDLKLENVMMTDDSPTSVPKLVDFGLSAIISPERRIKDSVGTISYAAPEILKGERYDKMVDIWSLGVIIFVLLGGYLPFDAEEKPQIVDRTLNEEVTFSDKKWLTISEEAKALVKAMLEKDKDARPSMEEILQRPWFQAHKGMQQERAKSFHNGKLNAIDQVNAVSMA